MHRSFFLLCKENKIENTTSHAANSLCFEVSHSASHNYEPTGIHVTFKPPPLSSTKPPSHLSMCDEVPGSRSKSVLLQGECKFPATNLLHFHRIKWFLKFHPKKQLNFNNFSTINLLCAKDDAGFSTAMMFSVRSRRRNSPLSGWCGSQAFRTKSDINVIKGTSVLLQD